MDISKYDGYFHDGSLIAIKHTGKEIKLFLMSAEVLPEEIGDDIKLNNTCGFYTIAGVLYLKNVKSIKVNNKKINCILKMTCDTGEIKSLDFCNNIVKLFVKWENYHPKLMEIGYDNIEIEYEKYEWENDPHLTDPN